MSGYLRYRADRWRPVHYRAVWTEQDPAPEWWAALDVAWMLDVDELGSVRENAARWGWRRSRAAALIAECVAEQVGWEDDPSRRAAIMASTARCSSASLDDPEPDGELFEMPGPLSHHDVVQRAVRWLRGHHGCRPVFAEISTYERVNPDAIGFRKPAGGMRAWSVLIEAKISRSDFRADRDKIIHRLPDLCPGQERWYLTPPNLVRPEEVPVGWGLAECGARSVRIVRPAPIAPEVNVQRAVCDMGILLSAVRRHECGAKWFDDLAKFEPYYAAKIEGARIAALKVEGGGG